MTELTAQAQRRERAINFVFHNLHIDNPNITREVVEAAYDRLAAKKVETNDRL